GITSTRDYIDRQWANLTATLTQRRKTLRVVLFALPPGSEYSHTPRVPGFQSFSPLLHTRRRLVGRRTVSNISSKPVNFMLAVTSAILTLKDVPVCLAYWKVINFFVLR